MSTDHTYKYFVLGNTVPVRVVFNSRGHKLGAEVPNADTGDLQVDFDVLRRVEESPEVDEIDQSRFETLCGELYSKKKGSAGFNGP